MLNISPELANQLARQPELAAVSGIATGDWRLNDSGKGLSAGEKRMLAKARQILVSELALAEGTDEVAAESLLDQVLAS